MARKRARVERKEKIRTWPLYVLFAAFMALFVAFQGSPLSAVFGAVSLLLLITLIVMEFMVSGKQEGYKRSLIEIAVAFAIILLLWVALRFALNTSDPIDVVPSCSMLPALHRGDLIAVQGASPSTIRAPVVNVPKAAFDSMLANFSSENLVCLAYQRTQSGIALSQYERDGYSLGLFRFTGSSYALASGPPGLIQYVCGYQPVRDSNNSTSYEAYTQAIVINGTTVRENLNNSIVVYRTLPQDYFYQLGDSFVVHRAYALLNVSGSYYVLTKGDNNPALDIQFMNMPANMSDIQGTVLFSVPYLGYLKLIVSGQLAQPEGCNSTVVH